MAKTTKKTLFILINCSDEIEATFQTLDQAKEEAYDGCKIYEVIRRLDVTYELKYEEIKLG